MNRFSFLEQDYPELYLVCSDAMQYGLQDFSIAMLKSRQALEKIVEHFDAEGENLFSKINALGDDGEIPKSVMKHFHTVRKIANPSVHGQEVSEQEILEALDALFEIAVWFAVQKEGHRYEPELFNDRDRFLVRRYENQTGDEDVTNNGKSSGPSQKIDFRKILDEYRKAAEAGDAEAMRTVGEIYAMGKGVVQDYGEAIEWNQKAVNVGNTSAMIAMGKLYAEGKGVEQNFGEAMKWYEKAADAGNIDAAAMLGECYENGNGVPQDYAEALRRYQSAAEMGSVVAMRGMSRLCAEGNGITRDVKAALQWLEKAAQKGDSEAMKLLADKYLHGEWGLIKNPDEALAWLRKAHYAGDMDAALEIGKLYSDGERFGVTKNGNEAAKWFEKAAQKGNAEGMRRLGDLHLWGKYFIEFDETYNKEFSHVPHEENDECDIDFLHGYYEDIAHCGLHYRYKSHQMYIIQDTGKVVAISNDDIAVKWYRKAAALGDIVAIARLGIGYVKDMRGIIDLPMDKNEGIKLLRKSSDAGNTDAIRCLGEMLRDGDGIQQDTSQALQYFIRAANWGSIQSMLELCSMYDFGRGVPKDEYIATKWGSPSE